MVDLSERIPKPLKKVNNCFIKCLNFILIVPVFFVGIGIAHVLWRISSRNGRSKKREQARWKKYGAENDPLRQY